MATGVAVRRVAGRLGLAVAIGAGLLAACKKTDSVSPGATTAALRTQAVAQYATIVQASYEDARDGAVNLRTTLAAFVAAPSAAGLTAARNAYIAARAPYEHTEAYRFYGGPIDGADGPEGLMNGWPMDESYVDYVVSDSTGGVKHYTTTGIINNASAYPSLTKDVLAGLNEGGGNETNISCGYHAIEFLLWGQDLYADSPGRRPYTDYLAGAGGTAANQARRGQYLLALADLLVDDLNQVLAQWQPNQSNYRKAFVAMPADSALTRIFNGLGQFDKGELYGERMQVAYNTRDQEDEHSCFSDQTHNDFIWGQQSIDDVYYGRYTRPDGTVLDGVGMDDVVREKSATAETSMETALTNAKNAMAGIHPPFDQEINHDAGRVRVKAALDAGNAEATAIVEAAKAAGITVIL